MSTYAQQPERFNDGAVKLKAGGNYLLKNGSTTGPLLYLPGKDQRVGNCSELDPQPWYSRKLDLWFFYDGTAGPWVYDSFTIIGEVVE